MFIQIKSLCERPHIPNEYSRRISKNKIFIVVAKSKGL